MEHCTPHTRAVHTAKSLERKVAGRENRFQLLEVELLPGGFHHVVVESSQPPAAEKKSPQHVKLAVYYSSWH